MTIQNTEDIKEIILNIHKMIDTISDKDILAKIYTFIKYLK